MSGIGGETRTGVSAPHERCHAARTSGGVRSFERRWTPAAVVARAMSVRELISKVVAGCRLPVAEC
jgi:hypothetical protein